MEWPVAIDFWHWWIAALIFITLEAISPAAFFLWLGIAAAFTGLLLLFVPDLDWDYQLLFFSLSSIANLAFGWMYFQRRPLQLQTDQPRLNRRGEQYIDRIFTLEEPIHNGFGKLKVDDTHWKISGEDTAGGEQVKVVAVDGVVLQVERTPRTDG